MQANSINRLTIDWTTFRASILAQASGAQAVADTYPAIRTAILLLGDGHSSFRSPTGFVISAPNRACVAPAASTPTVPATIGYVKVDRVQRHRRRSRGVRQRHPAGHHVRRPG